MTALAGSARIAAPPVRPRMAWRPPRTAVMGCSAVIAVTGGAWFGGLPIAVAAGAVFALANSAVRASELRRAQRRDRADLALAVRVLSAELAGGALAPDALRAAAECGGSCAAVFAEAGHVVTDGGDAAGVLLAADATRTVGIAWQLAQHTGCGLADVLARVAADMAAVSEQQRGVAVVLSGPRSSAAVLTGLPAVGLAMGFAMDAQPLAFLFESSAGRWVCCAGVLLDVAGVVWVRQILRAAERA